MQAVESVRSTLSPQEQLQQGEQEGPKAPLPVGAGAIKFVSRSGECGVFLGFVSRCSDCGVCLEGPEAPLPVDAGAQICVEEW